MNIQKIQTPFSEWFHRAGSLLKARNPYLCAIAWFIMHSFTSNKVSCSRANQSGSCFIFLFICCDTVYIIKFILLNLIFIMLIMSFLQKWSNQFSHFYAFLYKYDFEEKVRIIRNELLFLCILSMCKLWQITNKFHINKGFIQFVSDSPEFTHQK